MFVSTFIIFLLHGNFMCIQKLHYVKINIPILEIVVRHFNFTMPPKQQCPNYAASSRQYEHRWCVSYRCTVDCVIPQYVGTFPCDVTAQELTYSKGILLYSVVCPKKCAHVLWIDQTLELLTWLGSTLWSCVLSVSATMRKDIFALWWVYSDGWNPHTR